MGLLNEAKRRHAKKKSNVKKNHKRNNKRKSWEGVDIIHICYVTVMAIITTLVAISKAIVSLASTEEWSVVPTVSNKQPQTSINESIRNLIDSSMAIISLYNHFRC